MAVRRRSSREPRRTLLPHHLRYGVGSAAAFIGSRSEIADFLHDIADCEIRLSREEESRLALLAAAGCRDSFQRLVRSQLPFVVRLASEIHNSMSGPGAEFCDLVQHGCLSLARAMPKFNPERGRLSTFTAMVVRQRMRQYSWCNKSAIYRPPNPTNYTKKNRAKADAVRHVASLDEMFSTTPPDSDGNGGGSAGLSEFLYTSDAGEIESIELAELVKLLRAAIDDLPDRERTIIRGRMDGLTLGEVGGLVGGISKERVRQIESRAMAKLRDVMGRAVGMQVVGQRDTV